MSHTARAGPLLLETFAGEAVRTPVLAHCDSKTALRQQCSAWRDDIDPADHARDSAAIVERLLVHACIRDARSVGLYSPIRSEVAIQTLFRRLLDRHVLCAFPRVPRSATELEFVTVEDTATLRPGTFGVLEPVGTSMPLASLDVILVPGLAFDCAGNRLGYGGGFYDRTLAAYAGKTLGVAFGLQILSAVPTAWGDQPVDEVVTERSTLAPLTPTEREARSR